MCEGPLVNQPGIDSMAKTKPSLNLEPSLRRAAALCGSCLPARRLAPAVLAALLLASPPVGKAAGIAYGTVNNFDTVNDTSNVCHGFEIELDDLASSDITYTYDYNHYGTPQITEDTFSSPGHTNVHIFYEAIWTNSGWSAYTAIPTFAIPPTAGHQFTNPGTNFGGEHFGVGFRPI